MELLLIMRDNETGEVLAEKVVNRAGKNPRRIIDAYYILYETAIREKMGIDKWNSRPVDN